MCFEKTTKVVINHVLSAVRPVTLRTRSQSDLDFSKYELRKNFKGFMAHAMRPSEALEFLDNGPKHKDDRIGKVYLTSKPDLGSARKKATSNAPVHKKTQVREDPPCPYGPCNKKGLKHCIKDCPYSSDSGKTRMHAELAASKEG